MRQILRVILEFDNETEIIEGDDAQKWLDTIRSQSVLNYVHGIKFPDINWKIYKKDQNHKKI